MRPRLLDLFCGAGGAAMGYHRAGFEVIGVDIKPQPHYPFEFHQGDATTWPLEGFDAVHASPPCQRWAEAGTKRKLGTGGHPDHLTPTRQRLQEWAGSHVIENIPTAPMPNAFLLCGTTFGLPIIRHRQFEVNPSIGLVPSLCHQTRSARSVGHPGTFPYARKSWRESWRTYVLPVVWPWMTLEEAGEAIPPDYTEFIGRQLLELPI